jgi:archaellum component FlaF (FlaF/FlaG flagellin family)
MGFSLVGAFAIIGVSILMVFEILTGNLLPAVTDYNNAYDDMKDRIIDQVQTDISITNVTTPANASNYDLNFTVENTGGVCLKTDDFDVLINGTSYNFTCTNSYLYIDSSVYFNVTNLSGTGERRLKIVTNNGISDYYTYTIS